MNKLDSPYTKIENSDKLLQFSLYEIYYNLIIYCSYFERALFFSFIRVCRKSHAVYMIYDREMEMFFKRTD